MQSCVSIEADRENLKKAILAAKALATYRPVAVGPHFLVGKCSMLLEDWPTAVRALEQSASNEKFDTSNEASAEAVRLTAIEAKALAAQCMQSLAQQLLQSTDPNDKAQSDDYYKRSFKLADEAVKAKPDAPKYYVIRAMASQYLGNKEEAKSDIAQALKLDPKNELALGMQAMYSNSEAVKK
jgi:tetratricopeptide (TPR) repeat protein